jgi:glycosyltransferase involved in cell wall biosynthesis
MVKPVVGYDAAHLTTVHVVTRMNIGGVARHIDALVGALAARGYTTSLLIGRVSTSERELLGSTKPVRIPGLGRPLRPFRDYEAGRLISQFINAESPAIVHTHQAKAGGLGRIAARRCGVPCVVHTYHGHVLDQYFSPPVERVLIQVERRLARISDALVAVSPAVRDQLLDLGVGRPSQWRVMPLVLDLGDLLSTSPDPVTARASLSLPLGVPIVGIVGRLVPVKDHRTFLAAARLVLDRAPNAHFVVAGDGDLRGELQALGAGLGDRLQFLGWVEDLPNLYAALDVVVATSLNEGTPVALIEAGAAGVPVVGTAVGGVPDLVHEGRTGLLAPPMDAEQVARCIVRLLDDPARAACMGAAARSWIGSRFGRSTFADGTDDLYREVLAKKGVAGITG